MTGKIVKDENGKTVWEPGLLKCVKGIGWFIEEFGVAQISMNLTNISIRHNRKTKTKHIACVYTENTRNTT